jgi:hypothetical protein
MTGSCSGATGTADGVANEYPGCLFIYCICNKVNPAPAGFMQLH